MCNRHNIVTVPKVPEPKGFCTAKVTLWDCLCAVAAFGLIVFSCLDYIHAP